MSQYKMKPQIMLYSGEYFDFLKPEKSKFTIEDIAVGLSRTNRFAGQSSAAYNVAQHCTLCSYIVAPEHALAAHLHDAGEAFLGDCVSPLKQLLDDYRVIEERVERVICKKFGIPFPHHPDIKRADLKMLATEVRDLQSPDAQWEMLRGIEPLTRKIVPWGSEKSERKFLERFYELTENK